MVIVGVYPYIATCNNQHGYDATTKLFYLQMIAQGMCDIACNVHATQQLKCLLRPMVTQFKFLV